MNDAATDPVEVQTESGVMNMKGAFVESLKRNNKKIREDRAQAIAEEAELVYKRYIEDLEVDIKKMIRDRENMLDLSPDSAVSLILATDFKAKDYVKKDAELSLNIRNANIELELAKKRYKRLFTGE